MPTPHLAASDGHVEILDKRGDEHLAVPRKGPRDEDRTRFILCRVREERNVKRGEARLRLLEVERGGSVDDNNDLAKVGFANVVSLTKFNLKNSGGKNGAADAPQNRIVKVQFAEAIWYDGGRVSFKVNGVLHRRINLHKKVNEGEGAVNQRRGGSQVGESIRAIHILNNVIDNCDDAVFVRDGRVGGVAKHREVALANEGAVADQNIVAGLVVGDGEAA